MARNGSDRRLAQEVAVAYVPGGPASATPPLRTGAAEGVPVKFSMQCAHASGRSFLRIADTAMFRQDADRGRSSRKPSLPLTQSGVHIEPPFAGRFRNGA
jgi:hypothetical protein